MDEQQKIEVFIDLEGNQKQTESKYEKNVIAEDAYDGEIFKIEKGISPNYDNPKLLETKFIFVCKIDGKDFPFYVKPNITRGSTSKRGKSYSNSKLFDVLDKAKLLQEVATRGEELKTFDGLQAFLAQNLVGRKARLLTKLVNKGKDNAYSKVSDIVRFL